MRLKIGSLILMLLVCVSSVFAQLSDEQLVEILRQHHERGSSQMEVMEDMQQKGVSMQRLKQLEQKFREEGLVSAKTIKISRQRSSDPEAVEDPVEAEQGVVEEKNEEDKILKIFGQNLFTNKQLDFNPNLNIPIPDDYVLGPGDEIIIDIWGNSQLSDQQTISPDGDIVLSDVGRVVLSGLKMKDATRRIKNAYAKVYSDLNSGGTQLKVTIGKLRSIQVNILGEVATPGTYTISSLSTVFHALYVAGGISPIGTLRNINVYREGKSFASVDVYQYLMKGENQGDVILKDGDVVLVGTYEMLVNVSGLVKRPMQYEMKRTEKLEDLLYYAGGFAEKAYSQNVQLSRVGENGHQFYTVEKSEFSSFGLKNGDAITVSAVLDEYENKVEIRGAVYREGDYSIDEKIKTVKDLLRAAGGLKGDAYRERAILYRQAEDLTRESESFNIGDLLNGVVADIPLRKNDVLFVPSILSTKESQFITIRGEVKNPGQYEFFKNMNVGDVILQAGDLLESASRAKIDIYRRGYVDKKIETFSLSLDEGIEKTNSFVLEPYDEIFIYKDFGYQKQENVAIIGEVNYPGVFAKLNKGETVSSLIERAGGFTEDAYIEGCRLVRRMNEEERLRTQRTYEKIKRDESLTNDSLMSNEFNLSEDYVIGLNFREIMENKGGKDDIILREGDKLYVPQYNGVVKISGAVANPTVVPYQKSGILNYIDHAGGYEKRAAKCKKYVVYMNGETMKLRFARQIKPGCEVVIPFKKDKRNLAPGEVVGITTSVVSLSSVITTLVVTLAK